MGAAFGKVSTAFTQGISFGWNANWWRILQI
ncbi:MAG: hypothetical protein R2784_00230 [Saprospiraceae bacterium]